MSMEPESTKQQQPIRSTKQLVISRTGLEVLSALLGLSQPQPTLSDMIDAVVVAIDFEGITNITDENPLKLGSQVGLAILDTRDLIFCDSLDARSGSRAKSALRDSRIVTHCIATGPVHYCAKAKSKFLFGHTQVVGRRDLRQAIESLIPLNRAIILAGHDIKNDLAALCALRFDFKNVRKILDTMWIAAEVFPWWSFSLSDLLRELDCKFDRLHNAGNDAHFTLKALLLLTARAHNTSDGCHEKLALLNDIGHSPFPHCTSPGEKAAVKKAKRLERSRKYQSRFWDEEKQEQIRIERKAKKDTEFQRGSEPSTLLGNVENALTDTVNE